jgi:hypothetical protein
MGNTKNPDSTPFHDGYRLGYKTAEEVTGRDAQREPLADALREIEDYDAQEEFAEGFWHGVDSAEEDAN